jgi:hypothetical protein
MSTIIDYDCEVSEIITEADKALCLEEETTCGKSTAARTPSTRRTRRRSSSRVSSKKRNTVKPNGQMGRSSGWELFYTHTVEQHVLCLYLIMDFVSKS